MKISLFGCLSLALFAPALCGQQEPLTRVMRRMDLPVQLGPTGLAGYVYKSGIVITQVRSDGPAASKIEPGDYLVGAQGERFASGQDPRKALGLVISEVEGGDGKLQLELLRADTSLTRYVRLERRGSYSATWPISCQKSERILQEACDYLLRHQESALFRTNHVTRGANGLLLLASAELRHLELARRTAYRIVKDPLTAGYTGWSRSYAGIFLAEYYLATRDEIVVPKLKELARTIPAGQMACGSWGHRMPFDGYGAVNQIGLACWLAMILIEECGIDVDDEAMQRSADFFAQFAGKGWVPYGDHTPYRGKSGAGKNALAAVAFDLLDQRERETREYAISTAASFDYREIGHTGAFFSFLWGPLGAWRASQEDFVRFVEEQRWYYDLARTHDGGFVCQPNPENLSGRTPGSYTQWGAPGTTGAMALFYALPGGRLRIFGKSPEASNARVSMSALDRHALSMMRTSLRQGDGYMARQYLEGVQMANGELPARYRQFWQRIEEERSHEPGEQFHRFAANAHKNPRAYREIQKMASEERFAKRPGASHYAKLAQDLMESILPPAKAAKNWNVVWDSRKPKRRSPAAGATGLRLLARCGAGSQLYCGEVLVAEFGEEVGRPAGLTVDLPLAVAQLLRNGAKPEWRFVGAKKNDWVQILATEEPR